MEVDGEVPSPQLLTSLLFQNYGHFTAMQVRDRKTRGLDLHAERLLAQHREVFRETLDVDHVLTLAAHAVNDRPDASVRIVLTEGPQVTVVVDPPVEPPSTPVRLRTVVTERHLPNVKHLGTFMQRYYATQAAATGADDALFVTASGQVLESSIWNVAFVFDDTAVFPDGPVLHGITEQLLCRHAAEHGINVTRRPIALHEVARASGALLTNSWGIAPVAGVNSHVWPKWHDVAAQLTNLYQCLPSLPLATLRPSAHT